MDTNDTNVDMKEREKPQKLVAPVYLGNHSSSVMVIPKRLAQKYNIDKPCHVVIEDTGKGIFIKKLDLD